MGDITLPNGNILKDVPEGTEEAQVQAAAIQLGLATAQDFGVVSAPAENLPWYMDVGNFFKENAEIPGGLGGAAAGAGAGFLVGGPVGALVGSIVGGAAGSAGGSLLSDDLAGEELDYAEATKEAAISLGFDVATLGLFRYGRSFFKTMKSLGKSPQQAAQEIAGRARVGSQVGSQESLAASQSILAQGGATLTPFQTGNATGLQIFFQRLGETGILSGKIGADNLSKVNQIVSDSLEEIISRSGTDLAPDSSALGLRMYEVIEAGKKASTELYGEGLAQVNSLLGNRMVRPTLIRNRLTAFLDRNAREFGSVLDDDTVKYANSLLETFPENASMRATSLLDFQKKINSQISKLGDFNSGVYNGVAERELAQLSSEIGDAISKTIRGVSPEAATRYAAINKAYSEGMSGMLPTINSSFVRGAAKDNYTMLGKMLTKNGNTDQVRSFMRSIDTAFAEVGRLDSGTAKMAFTSAKEAKEAIKQGFLRQSFPNLGETFSIGKWQNRAAQWSDPSVKSRLRVILGEDYPQVKQLVNIMSEASQTPGSNIGELVLRSKEYAAGGGVALAGLTGVGAGSAAALVGAVLFGPVMLAKIATNPGYVNKILMLNKMKFQSQEALVVAANNLALDVISSLPESERTQMTREISAIQQFVENNRYR